MSKAPIEILREGCAVLDPVMRKYGFSRVECVAGKGSGGHYASGGYAKDDRRLEFSYRYSLGLVTYRFGKSSIDHESYMHSVPGAKSNHRYPGFSNDPLSGFHGLAYDLEHFAVSFLLGDFAKFSQSVVAAETWKKQPGLARLP
jgi:hypothetical protein